MYQRRYTVGIAINLLAAFLLLTSSSALASPAYAPEGSTVRFEGMIEAIGLKKWVIQGVTLFVSACAEIIEEAGKAEVGAWVTVSATWQPDGNLWANWIRVDRPAGAPGEVIEFTGLIERIETQRWVVSGVEVCILPETVIKGQPKVGVPARVRAQWQADCWQALEITTYPAIGDEGQVQFEGTIEAIGPTLWVVSGVAVEITEDTTVAGEPQVGRRAEVTAYLQAGGRLWAQHILVISAADDRTRRFGGLITAIHSGQQPQEWMITELEPVAKTDETTVLVNGSTLIDQSRAVAAPGMWAEVTAYREDDGRLWARRIRIERPVAVAIEGTLDTAPTGSSGWWLVDNHRVYVHERTVIVGTLLTGMRVYVTGLMLGNGSIWAERIWPL